MKAERRMDIGILRQSATELFESTRRVDHQLLDRERDKMLKLTFGLTLQNTYMLLELLAEKE